MFNFSKFFSKEFNRKEFKKSFSSFFNESVEADAIDMVSTLTPTTEYFLPQSKPPSNNSNSTHSTPTLSNLTRPSAPSFETYGVRAEEELPEWDEEDERKDKIGWVEVSMIEVKNAIFSAKTTASPGIDNIPVTVLRTLWPVLEERVTRLYQAIIRSGYHPRSWKEAVVVIIKKPRKPNYALPGA